MGNTAWHSLILLLNYFLAYQNRETTKGELAGWEERRKILLLLKP